MDHIHWATHFHLRSFLLTLTIFCFMTGDLLGSISVAQENSSVRPFQIPGVSTPVYGFNSEGLFRFSPKLNEQSVQLIYSGSLLQLVNGQMVFIPLNGEGLASHNDFPFLSIIDGKIIIGNRNTKENDARSYLVLGKDQNPIVNPINLRKIELPFIVSEFPGDTRRPEVTIFQKELPDFTDQQLIFLSLKIPMFGPNYDQNKFISTTFAFLVQMDAQSNSLRLKSSPYLLDNEFYSEPKKLSGLFVSSKNKGEKQPFVYLRSPIMRKERINGIHVPFDSNYYSLLHKAFDLFLNANEEGDIDILSGHALPHQIETEVNEEGNQTLFSAEYKQVIRGKSNGEMDGEVWLKTQNRGFVIPELAALMKKTNESKNELHLAVIGSKTYRFEGIPYVNTLNSFIVVSSTGKLYLIHPDTDPILIGNLGESWSPNYVIDAFDFIGVKKRGRKDLNGENQYIQIILSYSAHDSKNTESNIIQKTQLINLHLVGKSKSEELERVISSPATTLLEYYITLDEMEKRFKRIGEDIVFDIFSPQSSEPNANQMLNSGIYVLLPHEGKSKSADFQRVYFKNDFPSINLFKMSDFQIDYRILPPVTVPGLGEINDTGVWSSDRKDLENTGKTSLGTLLHQGRIVPNLIENGYSPKQFVLNETLGGGETSQEVTNDRLEFLTIPIETHFNNPKNTRSDDGSFESGSAQSGGNTVDRFLFIITSQNRPSTFIPISLKLNKSFRKEEFISVNLLFIKSKKNQTKVYFIVTSKKNQNTSYEIFQLGQTDIFLKYFNSTENSENSLEISPLKEINHSVTITHQELLMVEVSTSRSLTSSEEHQPLNFQNTMGSIFSGDKFYLVVRVDLHHQPLILLNLDEGRFLKVNEMSSSNTFERAQLIDGEMPHPWQITKPVNLKPDAYLDQILIEIRKKINVLIKLLKKSSQKKKTSVPALIVEVPDQLESVIKQYLVHFLQTNKPLRREVSIFEPSGSLGEQNTFLNLLSQIPRYQKTGQLSVVIASASQLHGIKGIKGNILMPELDAAKIRDEIGSGTRHALASVWDGNKKEGPDSQKPSSPLAQPIDLLLDPNLNGHAAPEVLRIVVTTKRKISEISSNPGSKIIIDKITKVSTQPLDAGHLFIILNDLLSMVEKEKKEEFFYLISQNQDNNRLSKTERTDNRNTLLGIIAQLIFKNANEMKEYVYRQKGESKPLESFVSQYLEALFSYLTHPEHQYLKNIDHHLLINIIAKSVFQPIYPIRENDLPQDHFMRKIPTADDFIQLMHSKKGQRALLTDGVLRVIYSVLIRTMEGGQEKSSANGTHQVTMPATGAFVGPPGSGKTETIEILKHALELSSFDFNTSRAPTAKRANVFHINTSEINDDDAPAREKFFRELKIKIGQFVSGLDYGIGIIIIDEFTQGSNKFKNLMEFIKNMMDHGVQHNGVTYSTYRVALLMFGNTLKDESSQSPREALNNIISSLSQNSGVVNTDALLSRFYAITYVPNASTSSSFEVVAKNFAEIVKNNFIQNLSTIFISPVVFYQIAEAIKTQTLDNRVLNNAILNALNRVADINNRTISDKEAMITWSFKSELNLFHSNLNSSPEILAEFLSDHLKIITLNPEDKNEAAVFMSHFLVLCVERMREQLFSVLIKTIENSQIDLSVNSNLSYPVPRSQLIKGMTAYLTDHPMLNVSDYLKLMPLLFEPQLRENPLLKDRSFLSRMTTFLQSVTDNAESTKLNFLTLPITLVVPPHIENLPVENVSISPFPLSRNTAVYEATLELKKLLNQFKKNIELEDLFLMTDQRSQNDFQSNEVLFQQISSFIVTFVIKKMNEYDLTHEAEKYDQPYWDESTRLGLILSLVDTAILKMDWGTILSKHLRLFENLRKAPILVHDDKFALVSSNLQTPSPGGNLLRLRNLFQDDSKDPVTNLSRSPTFQDITLRGNVCASLLNTPVKIDN